MKMFFLAIVFVILIGVFYGSKLMSTPKAVVVVGDGKARYYVDVVRDAVSQARGLSGRESLAEAEGMLFVFTQALPRSFWMNEMNFPLDLLWIREGKVIGISENIPHPAANNGEIYRMASPEPADMVLEINAGEVKRKGMAVGDFIRLEEPNVDRRP